MKMPIMMIVPITVVMIRRFLLGFFWLPGKLAARSGSPEDSACACSVTRSTIVANGTTMAVEESARSTGGVRRGGKN